MDSYFKRVGNNLYVLLDPLQFKGSVAERTFQVVDWVDTDMGRFYALRSVADGKFTPPEIHASCFAAWDEPSVGPPQWASTISKTQRSGASSRNCTRE